MRRSLLAALLLLLAGAALGVSLLHYAHNHIVTHVDGTESRTIDVRLVAPMRSRYPQR